MPNAEVLVVAAAVEERFQRAPQLRREVVVLDAAQQGDGRLVGLQLTEATRAPGEVLLQLRVLFWWELPLDEVRQQPHQFVTPFHAFGLRPSEFEV
jgi:hypothetical protein